jgi:pyrroloquinoline quinone biosynthesis protein B
LPQWNCSCPQCESARSGAIPRRTQSCVAIGDGRDNWYLVNASPDISLQLLSFPELHPRAESLRNLPLGAVFLTNADLDHVLGLFSLREGTRFRIYATEAVKSAVERGLGLQTVLSCFCGPEWREPVFDKFEPLEKTEASAGSGIAYRAISLDGLPPPFVRDKVIGNGNSIAYQFRDQRTGKRLLVAPDVAAVNDALSEALQNSDAILFDGTFWSPDELTAVRPGAKLAGDMGHLTIRDSSLKLLSGFAAPKKVYIHINNTNPILAASSVERAAVESAGILVGEDGMEFEL